METFRVGAVLWIITKANNDLNKATLISLKIYLTCFTAVTCKLRILVAFDTPSYTKAVDSGTVGLKGMGLDLL